MILEWALSSSVPLTVLLVVVCVATLSLQAKGNSSCNQRPLEEFHALAEERDKQRRLRQEERTGRVRAEKELRGARLALAASGAATGSGDAGRDAATAPYPLRPIGAARSCFSQRNGTPRQPLLVPAARAVITLRSDIPEDSLEGLEGFSHVWVIYVFHANTDLGRIGGSGGGSGGKGRVRVPRLGGARLGVLATRSPHRPLPIGLSVAAVLRREGRRLWLGGVDLVDGSPVLDIKPYLPFCDALPQAMAPPWVCADAAVEPLALAGVRVPDSAAAQLRACWAAVAAADAAAGRAPLYADADGFVELVMQVLSRDIRSAHQRALAETAGAAWLSQDEVRSGDEAPAATLAPPAPDSLGFSVPELLASQPGSELPSQPDIPIPGAGRQRRPTRRGPMDEMRQLVRILVKVIPHSVGLVSLMEEGGGGNRISEEQIKLYLSSTLGDAPRPEWGVPGGWGTYLSELFTWASGRVITKEEAMRCAKREPGRSWEAIESELTKLGLMTANWPLPLTQAGLEAAQRAPASHTPKAAPPSKRPAAEHTHAAKRRNVVHDVDAMSECELWHQALRFLQAARRKADTSEPAAATALAGLRREAVSVPQAGGAAQVVGLPQAPGDAAALATAAAAAKEAQAQAPASATPIASLPHASAFLQVGPKAASQPGAWPEAGAAAPDPVTAAGEPPGAEPRGDRGAGAPGAGTAQAHEVTKPQAVRAVPQLPPGAAAAAAANAAGSHPMPSAQAASPARDASHAEQEHADWGGAAGGGLPAAISTAKLFRPTPLKASEGGGGGASLRRAAPGFDCGGVGELRSNAPAGAFRRPGCTGSPHVPGLRP
ncbi:hypothetical protein WJX81_003049 [Elliptochloris bilobata]|uniref:TsaA-like domain-containing protein n=1 Tax=Elliptochloris bilobata TaxID=381761 RepID=A0AAW1SLI4_9CHLO